jgi:PAS domain S-box-containing protein
MPGENGIEFLEAVREEYPDLPFILYTGKGSEEVASDAISSGVTDYLQKGSGTDQYTVLANRITNAVEAYRTQRERRRQLNAIESAQEGISILDDDGEFVFVNEAYATLYGYDPEEMVGTHWETLYREEDIPRIYDDILPTVEESGYWHGTTTGLRADGSTFVEDHVLTQTDHGELVCTVRDVSEQKALEREHRQTRTLLSTLFETLPVGVLAEDSSRNVLAANERLFDLFGFSGTPEDLVGTDCERLAEEASELFADSDDFVARINDIVASRSRVHDEELVLQDGRTFLRSYEPIELPDGSGHLWVYQDVTNRTNRERRLQQTTSRLEALFEQSPDMINVHDMDGNIIDPNPEFVDKTGYDEAALTEMKVWDIDQSLDPDTARTYWAEMDQGDRERLEGVYQRRDGTTFPAEVHIRRLALDGEDRFIVISRDVTERTEREQKLRAIQRRTQQLMETKTAAETAEIGVETARDVLGAQLSGVHLLDGDDSVLEPAAFVDTVCDSLESAPAYDRDATDDPPSVVVWEAFESGEVQYLDDIGTTQQLATATPARCAIVHPLDDHGVFIVSATEPEVFDSTDKALVEILASSLTVSLDRVEREKLLRQREQRLEAKNERLEEFATIVSHDLRNPLNVAEGHLELASEECTSDHLDAIERAHGRMNQLIVDLLALAQEGESATEVTTLALSEFVEQCWQTIDTRNATLVTEGECRIRADESRLCQLVENLVRNAVEHGGEDVTITVGDLPDGFYLEDDGVGIPADDRGDVFDTRYSTSDEGTGLGLNIVRQVAETHDWEIRVTESPGGGARFEITGVEFADT